MTSKFVFSKKGTDMCSSDYLIFRSYYKQEALDNKEECGYFSTFT